MAILSYLPTLDAHAHLKHTHSASDLASCGAVLAMTVSLEEASHTTIEMTRQSYGASAAIQEKWMPSSGLTNIPSKT
jgi:aerobic-type carbon monoxide dehydrogenase small subunit (CoxS/CutS family)